MPYNDQIHVWMPPKMQQRAFWHYQDLVEYVDDLRQGGTPEEGIARCLTLLADVGNN